MKHFLKILQISLIPKYIKEICRRWLFTCIHRTFNGYSVYRHKLSGNVADSILNGVCVGTYPVINSNKHTQVTLYTLNG